MKKLFAVLALTAAISFSFAQTKPEATKKETTSGTCVRKDGKTCVKKCTHAGAKKDCKQKKACCKKSK